MKSPIARACIVSVGLVVCAAEAHQFSVGARAFRESDAALASGDVAGAIARAAEAAEARAPGSPYPERGFARLFDVARDAEARDDVATAEDALRAARRAALETRSPFGSSDARRSDAEMALARLAARGDAGPLAAAKPSPEAVRAMLAEDDRPATWAIALLALGSLLFFGGAAIATTAERTRARVAAAACALGAVLLAIAATR